ncbi:MAG: N-acetylmuramoyl-L-alanine amidase, partial [Flavisolibacter sp.]
MVAPIIQVGIVHYTSGEANKAIQILKVFQSEGGYEEEVKIHAQNGVSQEQWLMLAYVVTSGILFAGFVLSLKRINSILRSHTIQWIEKIKFVSTKVAGTPFSFFNFIFWNEEIDLRTETGKQIFQHELVHVREKHTLDKIIIQLVLVVYWCNPFFWLIRRELKLIHEFIADEKSVGEHGTAALAAMILKSSYPAQFNTLTNQFFQTSIKRRLAMLSKIQHAKINYLSRLLALPIVAATVLAFTLKTKTILTPVTNLEKTMTVVIDAGHGIMEDGKPNGVSVDGVSEDYIVLSIANKIKELNSNNKLKIVLTRSSDKIIDLHKRVDIAKENNAALFISLHVDAKPDNRNPGLSSDQSLNSGFGVYVSNKEPAYQNKSEIFGSVLQEELNSVYPTNPYLLKRKVGVWVLDQNVCPSVLVECGFLTDEKDRAYITKEGNQTIIAQKILQAIGRYEMSQGTTQKIIRDTIPRKQPPSKVEVSKDGSGNQKLDGIRLNTKIQPLVLVDGEEMSKEEMEKIDPSTIESINVLKGDTATAKYGKKAANGAIEIRLKESKT